MSLSANAVSLASIRHRTRVLALTGVNMISGVYVLALTGYLALRTVFEDRFWWLDLLNNFAPYYFLPLVVFLPWAILTRRQRTLVGLLVLTGIGVLWFGSYFVPKAYSAPAGPTLRLVTFNMLEDNKRRDDIEAWLREVNADVVLLQEVPAAYARNGLLHDLYPYQAAQPPSRQGYISESIIVLSRYPILSSEDFRLRYGSTLYQQRLVLDVDGQQIAVYHVHLPTPQVVPRLLRTLFRYNTTERDAEINDLLLRLQNETLPYIAAGDFNTSDFSIIYGQFAAFMSDSFREAGFGLGASWPVKEGSHPLAIFPPLLRIDYIWHSVHFRAVTADQGPRLGSDHLPLLATLEILLR